MFAGVVVTAYAGRAWVSPSWPMGLLILAGAVAVLAASAVVARRVLPGAVRPSTESTPSLSDSGRQYADVVK